MIGMAIALSDRRFAGARLAGAVLRLGHGRGDRRFADRVDHHKIDIEGCNETLMHGLSLNRCAAHGPH